MMTATNTLEISNYEDRTSTFILVILWDSVVIYAARHACSG